MLRLTSNLRFLTPARLLLGTHVGFITKWKVNKGFGFIRCSDGPDKGKDFFFHISEIQVVEGGNQSVIPGQRVGYDAVTSQDGKMSAVKITRPNGTPLPSGPRRMPRPMRAYLQEEGEGAPQEEGNNGGAPAVEGGWNQPPPPLPPQQQQRGRGDGGQQQQWGGQQQQWGGQQQPQGQGQGQQRGRGGWNQQQQWGGQQQQQQWGGQQQNGRPGQW